MDGKTKIGGQRKRMEEGDMGYQLVSILEDPARQNWQDGTADQRIHTHTDIRLGSGRKTI
jgi:hypothetical protein